jgi:ankyrin repeat protein
MDENIEMVELLLKHGAKAFVKTPGARTPLGEAYQIGNKKLIRTLLTAGLDEHALKSATATHVGLVIDVDAADLVDRLLVAGVDPNQETGIKGVRQRPLYFATDRGQTDIIKVLLKHGADPELAGSNGETPLALAQRKAQAELVELLKGSVKPTVSQAVS